MIQTEVQWCFDQLIYWETKEDEWLRLDWTKMCQNISVKSFVFSSDKSYGFQRLERGCFSFEIETVCFWPEWENFLCLDTH